jgi:polyisoprenoid-binding protein YceI
MRTIKIFSLLLILTAVSIAQTKWEFDKSHTKVGFSVSHLVITDVEGLFKDYSGTVTTEGDDISTAKVDFSINTASISTENEGRDKHLRSDDFFNAEKFPQMTFKSKSMKKVNDKNYILIGDLTIRDVTKQVELDVRFNGMVKDPRGNTKAGFKISGEINRFDFNLKWNNKIEAGGLVVGKEVTLKIDLQLKKS